MKFKLVLNKSDTATRSLLLIPTEISNLQTPLNLIRDVKETVKPTHNAFQKRKSEIKENHDPKYEKLLKEESHPLLLTSNDGKSYNGKYLDNSKDSYFIFINTGKSFKVIPLKKWYKFQQSINYDTLSLEEAETLLKERGNLDEEKKWMMHNRKVKEEIDFDEVFDDDNSDEKCYEEEENEELTKEGKEINKIIKHDEVGYDLKREINQSQTERDNSTANQVKNMKISSGGNSKSNSEKSEDLKESDLVKMLKNTEMTIKELTTQIKRNFKITDDAKKVVQKFIKERCNHKKEIANGQPIRKLYLKK